MNKKQSLPVNVEAEKMLLGGMLRDPSSYWRIHDTVKAHYLSVDLHQKIFTAISDLCQQNRKLNLLTLQTMLPEEDESFQIDNVLAYLQVLLKNAEEITADDFADEVAEKASQRFLIKIGEDMIKEARSGRTNALSIASAMEHRLIDVMQQSSPNRPEQLGTVVERVYASSITSNNSSEDRAPGYKTGLNALDEILGRIMPGDLIYVLGSQGDGKSALLAQMAEAIAGFGPLAYFQNEMSNEQFATRQLSKYSNISVREIREGNYRMTDLDYLTKARERLVGSGIYLLQDPRMSMRHIRSHALAMKRSIGLKAIAIDQLTHIRGTKDFKSKFDRLEEVTSDQKSLALELEVPLICAVQRTRRGQRENQTPGIDDADAPSVERDADAVVAVWREENWLRRQKPDSKLGQEALANWHTKLIAAKGKAKIISLKVRSMEAYQERELEWIGSTTTFADL